MWAPKKRGERGYGGKMEGVGQETEDQNFHNIILCNVSSTIFRIRQRYGETVLKCMLKMGNKGLSFPRTLRECQRVLGRDWLN